MPNGFSFVNGIGIAPKCIMQIEIQQTLIEIGKQIIAIQSSLFALDNWIFRYILSVQ